MRSDPDLCNKAPTVGPQPADHETPGGNSTAITPKPHDITPDQFFGNEPMPGWGGDDLWMTPDRFDLDQDGIPSPF
ncbi:hypothetical protein [Ruegeria sp. EL01]|uniref:hypothetical protein n=1 Tax=Ruegeria sp. EL01 TaxID=2107578 RepID=UPI001C1F7F07|nr:hypothetical protein [Ruegeria sp. EL01]